MVERKVTVDKIWSRRFVLPKDKPIYRSEIYKFFQLIYDENLKVVKQFFACSKCDWSIKLNLNTNGNAQLRRHHCYVDFLKAQQEEEPEDPRGDAMTEVFLTMNDDHSEDMEIANGSPDGPLSSTVNEQKTPKTPKTPKTNSLIKKNKDKTPKTRQGKTSIKEEKEPNQKRSSARPPARQKVEKVEKAKKATIISPGHYVRSPLHLRDRAQFILPPKVKGKKTNTENVENESDQQARSKEDSGDHDGDHDDEDGNALPRNRKRIAKGMETNSTKPKKARVNSSDNNHKSTRTLRSGRKS